MKRQPALGVDVLAAILMAGVVASEPIIRRATRRRLGRDRRR
ncbi:hypothetical protein ACIOGZ_20030 [Kitasatospora sp. NPDC088160]